MSDVSPLPEFSQLIANASRASFPMSNRMPANDLPVEHRRALIALIDFVREYDIIILAELS
jgi:hypothetical protein